MTDTGTGRPDLVEVNRIFHDHECHYYDTRFAIVHDQSSAERARADVESLLGRALSPAERVVDVGCGTGWLAAGLRRAGLGAVGVDLSEGMLTKAREAGAWPLVQGDGERLPLPDASMDVVVCRGVLHHLPHAEAALAEWRRVVRPEGAVVLVEEPTPPVEADGARLVRVLLPLLHRDLSAEEDYWEIASMAANLHTFTPAQVRRLGAAAGFTRCDVRSTGFASTLTLTASYVVHGRRPGLARRLPFRSMESAARVADRWVWDRVLREDRRHTITAVLRP